MATGAQIRGDRPGDVVDDEKKDADQDDGVWTDNDQEDGADGEGVDDTVDDVGLDSAGGPGAIVEGAADDGSGKADTMTMP